MGGRDRDVSWPGVFDVLSPASAFMQRSVFRIQDVIIRDFER
jgi:hypothetical protein